jgi:hypothetical protein
VAGDAADGGAAAVREEGAEAIAVSRMVSASPTVPAVTRSVWDCTDISRSCSA